MFMAEKGVAIEERPLNLLKREHKAADFRAKNSLGQVPVLELDDGVCISETVAICRYLDETNPGPSLFGATALERALVDMWTRRVEFIVMAPVGQYWRHAHPRTAALLTQYRDFGESNREAYEKALRWLDRDLGERAWLAGEAFSMADICLVTTVDFADWIGLSAPAGLPNFERWRTAMKARPSSTV
jgi:glutathione S-transferase